jgi:hypothetical protein
MNFSCEGQLSNFEKFDCFCLPANFVRQFQHRSDGQLQPADVGDVDDEEVVVNDKNVEYGVDILKLEASISDELKSGVDFNKRRYFPDLPIFCQTQNDDVERLFALVEAFDNTRTGLKVVGGEVIKHGVVL